MKNKYNIDEIKQKLKIHAQKIWEKTLYIVLSPIRFFKFLCFLLGLMTFIIIISVSFVSWDFYKDLPAIEKLTYSDLKKTAIQNIVKKLGKKSKIKKFRWVSIDKINRDLVYSIVMSEDSDFFQHDGIDYKSILDSLAHNIKKREYSSGASTITQQVTKNLFLNNAKTLTRKFREFIVSKRLESQFTKNQILEIYLNIAEFGPDIYGVKHASKDMFNKLPSKINVAEGAYLGLMLPSPRKYYYIIHQNKNLTKKTRKKIKRVLKDMVYHEFITYKQYLEYLKFKYN